MKKNNVVTSILKHKDKNLSFFPGQDWQAADDIFLE